MVQKRFGPSLIIYPKAFRVKTSRVKPICRQKLEILSPRLFASCKTLGSGKDPLNGQ